MDPSEKLMGKVLIVDDELRTLSIMEKLLENFEVKTARSGSEALEKIQSFVPDVVLLDIMMPGMDGYEVCRRIRQMRELRFTKIIFISGKVLIEERLAGYDAGGDDYVTKPFDHDELLAKLKVFLRLKRVDEVSEIKRELPDKGTREREGVGG
jgi:DNA-binding response OmpR family regulator